MKNCLLPFCLILILSGLSCNEAELQKQIDAEVIEPYFKLLTEAKYEDAYQIYTSDFYKKHNSFESYAKSYRDNIEKRGAFSGHEKGLFRVNYGLGGNHEINYEIGLRFEKMDYAKAVVFTIKKQPDGKYRIDGGWFNKRTSVADGLDGPF